MGCNECGGTRAPTASPTTAAPTTTPITDSNRDAAVQLWFEDPPSAEATFGHITVWLTSQLTNGDSFLQAWVGTNDNHADLFTKALAIELFTRHALAYFHD